jgi:hypothetical protein
MHCTNCMLRSQMWHPETWNPRGHASIAEAMFFHGKLKISLTKMSAIVENDERERMYPPRRQFDLQQRVDCLLQTLTASACRGLTCIDNDPKTSDQERPFLLQIHGEGPMPLSADSSRKGSDRRAPLLPLRYSARLL